MATNRRDFLRNGLAGALALSFRAAVTGLPATFLLNRVAHAVNESARFTIIAGSASGEAMNVSSPGAFPVGLNDIANLIMHPNPDQVGADVTRLINGRTLTAQDLATGVDLNLGSNIVRGASAYTVLEQSFLNHLVCFWHHTRTNSHPEYQSVIEAHGALKGPDGNGSEQLPSAIAQEMAPRLNTSTSRPFVIVGGGYKSEGVPLSEYRPRSIKDLMANNSSIQVDGDQFAALYSATIDETFRDVRANGTAEQRRFLDLHASTRAEATDLGDRLGGLLDSITGDGQHDQLLTAAALIMVKLAPVIVVKHDFSGDNHGDDNLADETRSTFDALESFDAYWKILRTYGLTDSVMLATTNVFGRTPHRNPNGGRDHYGQMTSGLIHATNLSGGIVGGLINGRGGVQAAGINANTGGTANPTMTNSDTLAAFTKTVMAAAGVTEARRDVRMPDAQTVTSIFS